MPTSSTAVWCCLLILALRCNAVVLADQLTGVPRLSSSRPPLAEPQCRGAPASVSLLLPTTPNWVSLDAVFLPDPLPAFPLRRSPECPVPPAPGSDFPPLCSTQGWKSKSDLGRPNTAHGEQWNLFFSSEFTSSLIFQYSNEIRLNVEFD
jgi:hypothetical protein